jgi:hypothetical protein
MPAAKLEFREEGDAVLPLFASQEFMYLVL